MEEGQFVPLYTPDSEAEAAVIAGLLDACGVAYFIRGGAMAKLYPGPRIQDYNTQTFMVRMGDLPDARMLLAEFIAPTAPPQSDGHYSLADKLRVLFEAVVFGWIVPGRRVRQTRQTRQTRKEGADD